jgi:hypothetical protein
MLYIHQPVQLHFKIFSLLSKTNERRFERIDEKMKNIQKSNGKGSMKR